MHRFKCRLSDGSTILLLLVTTHKHKYRFVNLTDDYLVPVKFKNPSQALDWLDKHFGPTCWTDVTDTIAAYERDIVACEAPNN